MLTRRNLKKNKQTFRVHSLDGQYLNVPTPEYANNSHSCPRFNRLSLDFTLHASITSLAGSNNSISASSQDGSASKEGEKLKLPTLNIGSITPRSGSPELPDSPKSWRIDRSPLPVRKLRFENIRGWGSCPSLLDEEIMKHSTEDSKDSFLFSIPDYQSGKSRDSNFDKSCESVFFSASSAEQLDQTRKLKTSERIGTDSRGESPEIVNASCTNATAEEAHVVVGVENDQNDETCFENDDIYDEVDATEKCMSWLKGLEASRNSSDENTSPSRMYRKLNTRLSSSLEAIVDY